MVQTVCGKVRPQELGHFQIHEHIWVHHTPLAEKNPALRIDDYEKSLAELKNYRLAGGGGFADAQPVAAGRNAEMLKKLSEESCVHIVASTGYHLNGFYPENCWIHSLGEEELFELYSSELEVGMLAWKEDPTVKPERTGIKAGLVKAAIPADGPVGRYAVLLRAAARAAAGSHVPLMIHTEKGLHVMEALDICYDAGLKPENIIICHVDRQASDYAPFDQIAAQGVWLDFDTVGRFKYHSDAEEVTLLQHLMPYADKIMLALDTTAARLHAYNGEIGLDYIFTDFVPQLRVAGFSEEIIRGYTTVNCWNAFAASTNK